VREAARLLLAAPGDGVARVRIHIEAGGLAGTEIHLAIGAARTVEALLLTPTEASRQTLIAAMERVRSRLRERGWAVVAHPPESPAPQD